MSYNGPKSNGRLDDHTSDGKITERSAAVLAQVRQQFPSTSWSCYSPRPGQPSEHSLGRACDGTFGTAIGVAAQGRALDLGWKVTNWMKTNANTLGDEYLIWQGTIWPVQRSAEGGRPTEGGGITDPRTEDGRLGKKGRR